MLRTTLSDAISQSQTRESKAGLPAAKDLYRATRAWLLTIQALQSEYRVESARYIAEDNRRLESQADEHRTLVEKLQADLQGNARWMQMLQKDQRVMDLMAKNSKEMRDLAQKAVIATHAGFVEVLMRQYDEPFAINACIEAIKLFDITGLVDALSRLPKIREDPGDERLLQEAQFQECARFIACLLRDSLDALAERSSTSSLDGSEDLNARARSVAAKCSARFRSIYDHLSSA